jgi:hypothetical protein
VRNISFCPWEDVVGIGFGNGFESIIIPGVGEPNIDFTLPNPLETTKQRTERPIKMLLDKLDPSTIMIDPNTVGVVMEAPKKQGDTFKRLVERQKRHEHKYASALPKAEKEDEDWDSEFDKDSDPEVGEMDKEKAAKKKKKKVKIKSIGKQKVNRNWAVLQKVKKDLYEQAEAKAAAIKEEKEKDRELDMDGMDRFFKSKRKADRARKKGQNM